MVKIEAEGEVKDNKRGSKMIVEKSFKCAKLTHQCGSEDMTLVIIPHPAIAGCCILTILEDETDSIRASITVNRSELKKVADMLCGINVD